MKSFYFEEENCMKEEQIGDGANYWTASTCRFFKACKNKGRSCIHRQRYKLNSAYHRMYCNKYSLIFRHYSETFTTEVSGRVFILDLLENFSCLLLLIFNFKIHMYWKRSRTRRANFCDLPTFLHDTYVEHETMLTLFSNHSRAGTSNHLEI